MPSRPIQSRARQSFFAGHGDWLRGAIGVCRGLSCELSGAAEIAALAGKHGVTATAYCLGHCDSSPAVLLPGGEVTHGQAAKDWARGAQAAAAPPEVSVRSVARRPIVTERLIQGSHAALARARQAGVYEALGKALHETTPEELLTVIEASGQQGRGGAGYPTGRKWRACSRTDDATRYVVANGDEGDPGTFIDRLLLEDDPHAVLEGLILCGRAIGAREGVVFIRGEYPHARARMAQAIVEAREAGLLGTSILGYDFTFDVRLVSGEGGYVCGEETALLNAIEGRRGEVRVRPPYPTDRGLFGKPTVVNNIETLVNIPWIVREGAEAYRRLGTTGSPGTKAFCLNRGFSRPGVVEAEFGINLQDLVETHAGGGADGGKLAAIVLGGPMGSVLTPAEWNVVIAYEALAERGVRLGHGGLVAIPSGTDMYNVLLNWAEFMTAESCGKCVPCGLGSRQALELVRRMRESPCQAGRLLDELTTLMRTVEAASLCGFGRGIASPIVTVAELLRCTGQTDG